MARSKNVECWMSKARWRSGGIKKKGVGTHLLHLQEGMHGGAVGGAVFISVDDVFTL